MSKKIKKISNSNPETLETAYELFNLTPDIELTKKEKKILRAIYEYEDMDFYSLCEWFDMRPSKLDKCLDMLDCYGLIDYMDTDDALVIIPTPLGDRICGSSKTEKKADKQLKKFLNQLTEDELLDFCDMCTDVLDEEEYDYDYDEDDLEVEIYEVSEDGADDSEEEIKF